MLHFRLQMHHSICQSIFLPGSHFERTVWLWCGASRLPCSPACSGLTEGQPGSLTPMPSPRPILLWALNQALSYFRSNLKIFMLWWDCSKISKYISFELLNWQITEEVELLDLYKSNTNMAIIKGDECESSYSDGCVSIAEPLTLAMEQV